MIILFKLIFLISIAAFIVGPENSGLFARWVGERGKNRQNILKRYRVLMLALFVLFAISGCSEETVAKKEQIDPSEAIKEDMEELIPYELKGENFFVDVYGQEERKVKIGLEPQDDKFLEPIACASDGLKILTTIRDDYPDTNDKVRYFEIIFFSEGEPVFKTIIDSSISVSLSSLNIVSLNSEGAATISSAKIEEFNRSRAEEITTEEKENYDTEITVEDLFSDTDGHMMEHVNLSGKIVQVMQGGNYNQYLLAVDDSLDTAVLIEISSDLLYSNILEGDYITIQGMSVGHTEYETVMGDTRAIPGIIVEDFIFN